MLSIARGAVEGLVPLVVVNRRVDTAIDQVDGRSDEPFPTIHQDRRRDLLTLARRTWRGGNERLHGTHGDGADAGRTVYGSVRFVAAEDAARGARSVVDALAAQGRVGVAAYGPVSFVLDPDDVSARATFAADDTGVTLARPRPPSDVAEVVAERLERGSPTASVPTVDELLAMPGQAARDAVRGWLLSDAIGQADGYIEAQVRRVAPQDVLAAAIDLRERGSDDHRPGLDAGPLPDGDDVGRLRTELERHGIAVELISPQR